MESTPKRFQDRAAASTWMTATFQAWAGSLTAGEREAIAAYKLDAYEPINEALRLGYDPGEEDQQIIANLDRALARFRLPEPVIVFRGFVDEAVREAPIGREFVDFAYFSTSLLQAVAEDIIISEPADERVLAQILVPGGARIGAEVGALDLVRDYGELEILLPRQSRFQVIGRESPEQIELEVILR